jgi:hypothetical protein
VGKPVRVWIDGWAMGRGTKSGRMMCSLDASLSTPPLRWYMDNNPPPHYMTQAYACPTTDVLRELEALYVMTCLLED